MYCAKWSLCCIRGRGASRTAWGAGASKSKYALCRCGASKNKPFCDGSHWAIEFKDDKN
ncbi:MAG: hypothetical protein GY792_23190 [Gammaproteobacteria bacterium]|nr:hypothetical protein [Gammaproteobacteria bacterium]